MENINEIKKKLYKEKPIAIFNHIKNGKAYYHTNVSDKEIWFEIPVDDMGDAVFSNTMEAKLLIRWINYTINK